jgi:hypothetical protein
VAVAAFAGAVEKSLSRLRISGHEFLEGIAAAIDGRLRADAQKGSDIGDLRRTERKRRHAFSGTALQDDGADAIAVLIVEYDHGTHQIGTAFAALGVGAVTETAGGNEQTLPALDSVGRGNRAAD